MVIFHRFLVCLPEGSTHLVALHPTERRTPEISMARRHCHLPSTKMGRWDGEQRDNMEFSHQRSGNYLGEGEFRYFSLVSTNNRYFRYFRYFSLNT